jgi:PLP dependent protein
MSIAENVDRLFGEIASAAISAGRDMADITLCAATKKNDADAVREAISAGVRVCGENRVQEMLEKKSQGAYEGAQLHFIGHLQRNKVKQTVGEAELIQSVDSAELLRLIDARARALGIVQQILIEVNIGGEAAKSGVAPDGLEALLLLCSQLTAVSVRGLMTIPPESAVIYANRRYFDEMYKLFVDINVKKYNNICMDVLSMGMSADFSEAIAAGATMVRVGTAIFGPRT